MNNETPETRIVRLDRSDIEKLLTNGELNVGVEAIGCDNCGEDILVELLIELDD